MLRRNLLIALIAPAVTAMLLPAGASLADERPPTARPQVTLSLPATGMAEVPISFRVTATPAAETGKGIVALQVKTSTGFVTQKQVRLDARGRADGKIVSKKDAERVYRAVLLSGKGKPVATSDPVKVTWTPLTYTVSLACARDGAPIGVDIPCTISVDPVVRVEGLVAILQVMGRTEWVQVEAARVPVRGVIKTDVEGFQTGVGNYRVLLLREAVVQAESAVVSIAYS